MKIFEKFNFKYLTIVTMWLIFFVFCKYQFFIFWHFEHFKLFFVQISLPFLYLLPFFTTILNFIKIDSIRLTIAIPLTLGLIAFLNLLLGYLNLFQMNIQLIIWIIFWIPEVLNKFKNIKKIINFFNVFKLNSIDANPLNHFLIIVIAYHFLNAWTNPRYGAIFPTTGFDLSVSHLTLIKNYIANEGFISPWWVRGTFIPQLVHLNFTGLILWSLNFVERADLLPSFYSTFCFIGLILIFQEYSKSKFSTLLFAIILISFPIFTWHLSTAYLDIYLTLFVFSVFTIFIKYSETLNPKFLYLLFFITGLAFSVKHFALILILPIYLYLAFYEWFILKKFEIKKIVIGISLFAIPFLCFYSINFKNNKNFLFPFLFNPNNSVFWDSNTLHIFKEAIHYFDKFKTFDQWIALPFYISNSSAYSDNPGYDLGYSYLLLWILGLAISIFAYQRKKFKIIGIFLIVCTQMYFWYHSSPVYRYFISILPILTALVVLNRNFLSLWLQKISLFLFILFGIFTYYPAFFPEPPPISKMQVILHLESRAATFEALNIFKNLEFEQKSEAILFQFQDEGNLLYYHTKYIGDWFTINNYFQIFNKTSEEYKSFFSSRKVTHFLQNGYATNLFVNISDNFGEYSKCFEKIISSNKWPKIYIFKLKTDDPFCYDKNVQEHPSISILKSDFKITEQLPFWRY